MIQERLRLGPIDLSLPGSMELHLGMVGDRVRESEAKFGFSKRFIDSLNFDSEESIQKME